MSRLPKPGSDNDKWGDILNDFLLVEHDVDGSLRPDGSLATKVGIGGDIGGTADAPLVQGLHLATPLAVAQGGTGATTQQFPIMRGGWGTQTAYRTNDMVQFQGGAFLCLAAHTSKPNVTGQAAAFQADFTSGKWQQLSPRSHWYDVRDYGAYIDGAANDTAAIQNALNAAGAGGGGCVFIPAGTTLVTTLVIPNRVNLTGAGMWATTIKSLSNTNAPVITNFVSPDGVQANAEYVSVRDLKIDGHLAGSSTGAGNTSTNAHGIYFSVNPTNTMATNDDKFDTHQLVQNVYIINCAGWGFKQDGRSETRIINAYAENCNLGGFAPSYDTFLVSCDAGANSGPGFYFAHGDILAVNCKSFLAGKPPFGKGGTVSNQPGFLADTVTASGLNMVGCTAQQNNGAGFYLRNTTTVAMSGCASIDNNFGPGNIADAFAGVEVENSSGCNIQFTSSVGRTGTTEQYALRVVSGANYNDISVGMAKAGTANAVTNNSIYLANRVTANGQAMNASLKTLAGQSDVAILAPADGQGLQYDANSGVWRNSTLAGNSFAGGVLGDGSDGVATLDGTASVGWATKSGNVYTLTRDALTTSLTIAAGVTLVATGYRLFCQGTIINNGTINANGNNATSATGAAASTSRSLQSGTKGGNGATGAGLGGGTAGGGFAVGTGGSGGNGTSAGAAGGAIASSQSWPLKAAQALATGSIGWAGSVVAVCGGSGGGGGGGDGANAGGGGGSGGGIICIFARSFTNNGILSVIGGNGFSPATGNCGGGGGGGGGLIALLTINPWTNTGSTLLAGGAGGSASGTGTSGASGGIGSITAVQLQ